MSIWLYVYTSVGLPANLHGQFAKFSFDGGATWSELVPGPATSFVEGENYIVVTAMSDAMGVITATMAKGDGNTKGEEAKQASAATSRTETPQLAVTAIDDTDTLNILYTQTSASLRTDATTTETGVLYVTGYLLYGGTGWQVFENLPATFHNGTATSSRNLNDCFEYTNVACTRIKWFCSKSSDRGMADVYLDGVFKQTVDTYAPSLQATSAVFDSGELPLGQHTIKVVVKHAKHASSTNYWIEHDKIEVTEDTTQRKGIPTLLQKTRDNDPKVLYFGKWIHARNELSFQQDCHLSNTPYNTCVFAFRGSTIRWIGSRGNNHGFADVYVDNVFQQTIDTYSPQLLTKQVLFEKTGLSADRIIHTMRIVVRKERHQNSTGCYQDIDCFESCQPVNYPNAIKHAAAMELKAITSGTKSYLSPDSWKPVAYAATAPTNGVALQLGVFNDCFNRNIIYLNRCFAKPYYTDEGTKLYKAAFWVTGLPASNEGRMLAGAGHTLRWGERSDMRKIVDTIVSSVQSRQRPDGYCLPYDETYMNKQEVALMDERRNYDRVNLTRGMLAAGMSGNAEALRVMRKFYDWLNSSQYYPELIAGNFYGSAHNCNNGHAGGLLMYFSPVGKPDDLVAVERYFVQDFFIDQAKNAEPLSLCYYPLHTPHSYLNLAFEAWLDHYRATGADKYIEAAKGAWKIVNENYEHVGGTMAICEEPQGSYPPKSYYLDKHTGETCGSVFWADVNHRLLQFYPCEEKYANEIEKVIYNVMMAAQSNNGSIRYLNNLRGFKDVPRCANTCCEVMGVRLIARLPQYVYSIADDGLYVNLFAASRIMWAQGGQNVTLANQTNFPYSPGVTLTVTTPAPKQMKIRIRVPSWANGNMTIKVNGENAATGTPGSYVSLDRTWSNNDMISFDIPMGFRLTKYTGLDQDVNHSYALEYGPLLMALVGSTDLDLNVASDKLIGCLSPISGSPLHFNVAGYPNCRFLPYWQVQTEKFTCFPTLR